MLGFHGEEVVRAHYIRCYDKTSTPEWCPTQTDFLKTSELLVGYGARMMQPSTESAVFLSKCGCWDLFLALSMQKRNKQ